MKRYSKKDREDAALICAMLSEDRFVNQPSSQLLDCPRGDSLAWMAFKHAADRIPRGTGSVRLEVATTWAEAEAMLRTRWTP